MIDLSYILEKLVLILFFASNIVIIWQDIRQRKIKNIQLLSLLLILPLWIYVYNITLDEFINHILISGLLFLGGILLYKEGGFIGAGDLKYASILILFTTGTPISMIVGNIGALTLLVLLFWWSMICGHIYALHKILPKNELLSGNFRGKKIGSIIKQGGIMLLDWIIIGFVLREAINWILSSIEPTHIVTGDFYFLLTIGVFLIRPIIRKYVFESQYGYLGFIGGIIFVSIKIQTYGIEGLLLDISSFAQSIWIYAVAIITIQLIADYTFKIHENITNLTGTQSQVNKTIPFSGIIFLAFCTLFFFNLSLISIAKYGV